VSTHCPAGRAPAPVAHKYWLSAHSSTFTHDRPSTLNRYPFPHVHVNAPLVFVHAPGAHSDGFDVHSLMSVQLGPFAPCVTWYPLGQLHVYVPCPFAHVPFPHGFVTTAHSFTSTHVPPTNVYPPWHVHAYDPAVFAHDPYPHGFTAAWHSFTSAHVGRPFAVVCVYPAGHAHVYDPCVFEHVPLLPHGFAHVPPSPLEALGAVHSSTSTQVVAPCTVPVLYPAGHWHVYPPPFGSFTHVAPLSVPQGFTAAWHSFVSTHCPGAGAPSQLNPSSHPHALFTHVPCAPHSFAPVHGCGGVPPSACAPPPSCGTAPSPAAPPSPPSLEVTLPSAALPSAPGSAPVSAWPGPPSAGESFRFSSGATQPVRAAEPTSNAAARAWRAGSRESIAAA